MFPPLLALTHGLAPGHALPLDKMSVGDSACLHGQVVRVTCPATAPPYTLGGWMVTGVEVGGVEFGVQLLGGPDIDQGEEITVVGVLKVTTTPATWVNGRQVPACTSVVVVGVRVR